MKKRFFAILALIPLLTGGCVSIVKSLTNSIGAGLDVVFGLDKDDFDKSTTIMYPDGTIIYAAYIDQFARKDADNKATSWRNVTQQQTQWVSTGAYNYEFNQGELKAGIAQGKYKLGQAEYRATTRVSIGEPGEAGVSFGGEQFVYQVLIPQTVNRTVAVKNVDQKVWQQTYAERLKYRQTNIRSQMTSTNVSPATANASSTRIRVMKRLEERLREGLQPGLKPAPGTKLIYGGWTGDKYEQENVLVAYLDENGAFVCEWHK